MRKLKLMTVVGTRPEIIKMSEIIKRCDECFDHVLVHTGQNYDYELNQIFFDELGLRKPDYYLGVVGNDLGETMGNVLSKSYKLMHDLKPDALIVLGDTNSCLCAISAKRLKIPIFHMEAGNRCFDDNLPEEVNRRIVDTVSDVNLCYSEHARRNLLQMGYATDRIFVVGSPMREVISAHSSAIEGSDALNRLSVKPGSYILLSAHREENIDNERNLNSIVDSINTLAEVYKIPILYSLHPRSKKVVESHEVQFHPLVRTYKPFGLPDYLKLQKHSYCVVSDSGTLAEESAIMGFPAVSLRTSTERPEVVDKGAFVLGGLCPDALCQAVELAVKGFAGCVEVQSYVSNRVSYAVLSIIQGYTGYVNARVWHK